MVWCDILWFDMGWDGMVRLGMTWCGLASFPSGWAGLLWLAWDSFGCVVDGVVWFCIVWFCLVRYGMIFYGVMIGVGCLGRCVADVVGIVLCDGERAAWCIYSV